MTQHGRRERNARPGPGAVQQDNDDIPPTNIQQEEILARLETLDTGKFFEIYNHSQKLFEQRLDKEKQVIASQRAREKREREDREAQEDRELLKRVKLEQVVHAGTALIDYVENLQRNDPGAEISDGIVESDLYEHTSADSTNEIEDEDEDSAGSEHRPGSVSMSEESKPDSENSVQEKQPRPECEPVPMVDVKDWETVFEEDGAWYVLRCPCFNKDGFNEDSFNEIGIDNDGAFYSQAMEETSVKSAWREHNNNSHFEVNGTIKSKDLVRKLGYPVENATAEWYDEFKARYQAQARLSRNNKTSDKKDEGRRVHAKSKKNARYAHISTKSSGQRIRFSLPLQIKHFE